jgi:hypothetical protein
VVALETLVLEMVEQPIALLMLEVPTRTLVQAAEAETILMAETAVQELSLLDTQISSIIE